MADKEQVADTRSSTDRKQCERPHHAGVNTFTGGGGGKRTCETTPIDEGT
jgi:hypothetical protein